MTYEYIKPAHRIDLDDLSTRKKVRLTFGALAAAALLVAIFLAVAPKSKPQPLATQPAVIQMPAAQTQVKPQFGMPAAAAYRNVDNAIRDIQMDNAHIGHKMKVAMKSDKNPIRTFFIKADRQFSLMGILIVLSFVFMLFSFGFVKTPGRDLSNY